MEDYAEARADRFMALKALAEELAIRIETLDVPYARLELVFNRVERAVVTYDDGHVRLREFERGFEMGWMPSARREFEAGKA